MVKRKKISKYFNKQWCGIRSNLDSLCTNWENDKLHDLRVNMKKGKAIVSLLKETNDHKNKFSFKRIKELFASAGEIRTSQLNLESLEKYQIDAEDLKNEQNASIKKCSEELCKKKDTYNRDIKKLKKTIEKNLFEIKNKKVISYYHKYIKQLSLNFFSPIDTDYLHDSRKIIKKLLYALKVLPISLQHQININKPYLDKLQDVIGNWHDTIITLELLSENGINDEGLLSSLIIKKQEDLEAIKSLSASFDIDVMYSKH